MHGSMDSWTMKIGSMYYWYEIVALRGCDRNLERRVVSITNEKYLTNVLQQIQAAFD